MSSKRGINRVNLKGLIENNPKKARKEKKRYDWVEQIENPEKDCRFKPKYKKYCT